MERREILTIDRECLGVVVGEFDDYFIVESGKLRKTRRALPKEFARPDANGSGYIVQMGRGLLANSPKLAGAGDGAIDGDVLAGYWGISRA